MRFVVIFLLFISPQGVKSIGENEIPVFSELK
jgi:hypothetical protein